MDDTDQNDQPAEDQPTGGRRRFTIARQFLWGFLGWYVLLGLIYSLQFIFDSWEGGDFQAISIWVIFPAQIGVLLLLILKKAHREAGWGMLSAIGVNMVISLMLGLVYNAICFIPFFWQDY